MATITYTYTTARRTPKPRSRRLRECGGNAVTAAKGGASAGGGGALTGDYLPLTGGTVTGDTTFEQRLTVDGPAHLQNGTVDISADEIPDIGEMTHVYVSGGARVYRMTVEQFEEYIYEHFNYLNALTDTLRFAGEGGSAALADIAASNGVYDGFETDHPLLTVADGLVTVGENPSSTAYILFTLTLTYRFADGGTRSLAIPGVQNPYTPGEVTFVSLTVTITAHTGASPSVTIDGTTAEGTTLSAAMVPGTDVVWSATDGNVTKGGSLTVWENTVIEVNLTMA